MRYDIIVWKDENLSVHVPATPGVYGVGATASAAHGDMLNYLEEIGEPRPSLRGRLRVRRVCRQRLTRAL
jgi:hypothetical protein